MSAPMGMPAPPRPKRLNRLALVAVLVVLGCAVTAVVTTLAPARKRGAAEPPESAAPGAPVHPGFLERQPAGGAPSAAASAASAATVAPPGVAGMGVGRPVGGEAAAAGGGPGASPWGWLPPDGGGGVDVEGLPEQAAGGVGGGMAAGGGVGGSGVGRTPPQTAREEAYRRALVAPVEALGAARGGALEGAGGAAGGGVAAGGGEVAARVFLPPQLPLGGPGAAGLGGGGVGLGGGGAGGGLAVGATGGAPGIGGGEPGALGVGGGGGGAPLAAGWQPAARDHQAFARGAEAIPAAELPVRREAAEVEGAGVWRLEAGTMIPAVLVTAINSDVAGPIVAQVSADVFDRSERRVLIPRGARLIGSYDSQLAPGENRLLVAWNRLLLPDGSSLSFPGLPAATPSGEAGLAGAVDNHVARVLTGALLLSILGAGAQLSQPQESAAFGNAASTRQVAAAAVGQELSTVAIELVRRQMSVPPTVRIAAGTRLYVILRGDLRIEGSGVP